MLISLLVVLVVVGVLLYLLNALVPLDPKIKTVINVIVGLCVFLWVLQIFGVFPAHMFGPGVGGNRLL